MSILRIGSIAVAGVLLALQFKNGKSEYGIYISVFLSVIISFYVIQYLKSLLRNFQMIGNYIAIDSVYVETLLKMLGITYIVKLSGDICKDAGYQTIAGQIEIAGKLIILALSMPIFVALLNTMQGFLK